MGGDSGWMLPIHTDSLNPDAPGRDVLVTRDLQKRKLRHAEL